MATKAAGHAPAAFFITAICLPDPRKIDMSDFSLHAIAEMLGGDIANANSISAPGPWHSASDRTLSVRFEPDAPDGFVLNSFAGDEWQVCRDYVRERLDGKIPETKPCNQNRDNIERARIIWREAAEIKFSLAAIYLARRGLSLDDDRDWHGVLRFHPACPFGKERAPAMIALMRDIPTGTPRCVQRTRLTPDGKKIDRQMLGPAKGAASKIDPDAHVTNGLSISEGLESAMSGRAMGFRPAWAVGSAKAIEAFPVLTAIERLNIFGELDESRTNENALYKCADRWIRAGREARVLWPETGNNLNDEWQAKNAVNSDSWRAAVQSLWPGAESFPEDENIFRQELKSLRALNDRAYRRSGHAN
jgi:putative DNA primase/helicase